MTSKPKQPHEHNKRKFSFGASLLLQRAQMRSDQQKILVEPEGYAKMSAIILDFARPLLALDPEREYFEEVVTLAIIAWNISLTLENMPERTLESLMQEALGEEFMEEDNEELVGQIKMLVRRRQKYFSKHKRLILDFQITESEDMFHLNVVSELV